MKQSILGCLLLVILTLVGCGNVEYHNKKADDDISKAIYEAVGEDVFYLTKEETSQGVLRYEYLIKEEQEDLLQNIVFMLNDAIKQSEIENKVNIFFEYELPGGTGWSVRLCNYSNDELTAPDCEGLQRLVISGNKHEYSGDYYNNPNSYINIPNIKYLEVRKNIYDRAEAEGIDWYEYWPELESVEVFE